LGLFSPSIQPKIGSFVEMTLLYPGVSSTLACRLALVFKSDSILREKKDVSKISPVLGA